MRRREKAGAAGTPPPSSPPSPPVWLRVLAACVLPRRDRRLLLVELDALYASRCARLGRFRARLWYLRTVGGFVARVGHETTGAVFRGTFTDLRVTARLLARRRGFAIASVLTLAVGLAGVTTVITIAHWVLLRPVPGVADPATLVGLRLGSSEAMRPSWKISHLDLLALRAGIRGLRSLEASDAIEANVAGDRGPAPMRLAGAVVTPGWFRTLGVRFAAGRALAAGEAEGPALANAEPAADPPELAGMGEVVIDHTLARALAPDPADAVGQRLNVNGELLAVVGVTAEGFAGDRFPGLQRFWVGTGSLSTVDRSISDDVFANGYAGIWSRLVGRASPGTTAASVQDQANVVRERVVAGARPHSFLAVHFVLQATSRHGLDPGLQGSVRRTLMLLGAAGTFLLLLAISNAANLGLAHATARQRVYAMHLALGIGRGRLLRQVCSEYLLMGLAAGVLTVVLVAATSGLLGAIRLDEFGGSLAGVRVEPRVMLVSGAIAAAGALLAGIGPCLLILRRRLLENLRGGAARSVGARRARDLLVVAQVGISTTLLVGAGLMARTILELRTADLGFEPAGAVTLTIDPESQGYSGDRIGALLRDIEGRLGSTPGVRAGFVYPQPLRSSYLTSWLQREAEAEQRGSVAAYLQVSGAFLDALGARVIAGDVDVESWSARPADAPRTALISRTAAHELLPEVPLADVPGTVVWERDRNRDFVPVQIAGVIEDVKLRGPSLDAPPIHVRPWAQGRYDGPAIAWVRAPHLSDERIAQASRAAVVEVDRAIPAFQVETVRGRLATIDATARVVAALATVVSGLALALAAIGLYSVLAHSVAEQRRELGIRAALGARSAALRRRVLVGGLARLLAGFGPGMVGAIVASRWLEALLHGVTSSDPVTYLVTGAVLLGAGTAASWFPARRAATVEPADVLRVEG